MRVLAVGRFLVQVFHRAREDRIFMMAGAIAFNVLVAVIPLFLLGLGIAGMLASARFGDPAQVVADHLVDALPVVGGDIDLVERVRAGIDGVVQGRTGFSLVGGAALLWISTWLVGTLRIVLAEVFHEEVGRGIIHGKLFDVGMVLVGGGLIAVNGGLTVIVEIVRDAGIGLLGLEGNLLEVTLALWARGAALLSLWLFFLLLFRYLPWPRIPWRAGAVAATFTAILIEGGKLLFGWYVIEVADYGSIYGNFTTAFVLLIWIYYGASVFILGGEVAREYMTGRARSLHWSSTSSMSAEAESSAGTGGTGVAAGLLLLLSMAVPGAAAQTLDLSGGMKFSAWALDRELSLDAPLVDADGPYIVVHIAENRVFLMEGRDVVWSTPAGTGTGFRLQGDGNRWKFSTPRGLFRVRRKEKNPVWEAPDWYYVERGLPIPAHNDPSRIIAGGMGTTALYLGDGLAIHGTNQPAQILNPDPEQRRISHGCIRLTNEAARDLFHRVGVGTPVLIY